MEGENTIIIKSANGLTKSASFDVKIHPSDLKKLLPSEINIRMNSGAHYYFTDEVSKEIWLPEQPYKKGTMGYLVGTK